MGGWWMERADGGQGFHETMSDEGEEVK